MYDYKNYIHSQELWVKEKGRETSTYFIKSWLVQVQTCSVRLKIIQNSLLSPHDLCLSFHLAEMLHLDRDATSYAYLNKSGCSTLAAVDDKQQFNVTIVSFCTVQINFFSRVLHHGLCLHCMHHACAQIRVNS